MRTLTEGERERYLRQIIIDEVGEVGQLRLAAGRVLIIGAGGLGSPVAFYLAAAGVGTIGLADDGEIELSNLQRQILHNTERLGQLKVESGKATLNALNPEVTVITYGLRLTAENAEEIIAQYDLVVSALDNLPTRYIVNRACIKLGKPLVEGGVMGFSGMLTTIIPGQGPCYNCIFPEDVTEQRKKPEGPIPVFATTPGIIGILQAQEVFKLLLKIGKPLVGKILFFDGLTTSFLEQEVKRSSSCSCCNGVQFEVESG